MAENHHNKSAGAFRNNLKNVNFGDLPIGEREEVEFSEEFADEADHGAQERAAAADRRMKSGE